MMKTTRIVLLLFVVLMMGTTSFAQSSYSHLEAVLDAQSKSLPKNLNKKDLNGDPASLVLVNSALAGLLFEGNVLDVTETQDITDGSNLYYVYITKGTKRLTIKHRSYIQTQIEFPKTVDSKQLWNVAVTGVDAPETNLVEGQDIEHKRNVNIKIEPWAKLYVDEMLSNNVISLEEGVHYISSRYDNTEYSQRVNIQKDNQEIDARLGGEVIVKNANDVSIIPIENNPMPNLDGEKSKRKKYHYDGMLGQYRLIGDPNVIDIISDVEKVISVDSRSHTIYNLADMIPYAFTMYHATAEQALGFNIGACGKIGGFMTLCSNLIDNIDTPYGNIKFKKKANSTSNNDEASSSEGSGYRSTLMTITMGPMFRLYRKLYMQTGVGWVRYLSTAEPGILTADYKYKRAFAVSADLIVRIKSFTFGFGYKHLSINNAYDANNTNTGMSVTNQVSFSIGLATGI